MQRLKSKSTTRLRQNKTVRSVLAIENPQQITPLVAGFDLLLLIVTEEILEANCTFYYSEDGYRIQERWMHPAMLEQWIVSEVNSHIIQWILQGEIWLDQDIYLESLRRRLYEFPKSLQERKLFVVFSFFLKSYSQSKRHLQEHRYLDAYSDIMAALHHWAHIVITEEGVILEGSVWNQVRRINPGVYKLYEELTSGTETLEQRTRLVLLACEFSVMSRMENCCRWLLCILESQEEAWSPMELAQHPHLQQLPVEMELILNKLLKKSLVKEVAIAVDGNLDRLELKYTRRKSSL